MSAKLGAAAPKLLVTGAAGRLGGAVADLVHAHGYEIVATDISAPADVPYRFERADLRDHEAARELLAGIDVLLHIGNHPTLGEKAPQVVFNENVAMNANMFQGAAEQGVGRIVFASTVQLIGSHIDERTVINEPSRPSYPMDGTTPADPSNLYALSKTVSEAMLRYFADRCGVDAVALRFPLLHEHQPWVAVSSGEESFTHVLEGFSGLTFSDAAALFLAVIRRELPGYRVYMPGTSHRHGDLTMPELLRRFYPDVPASNTDLIDLTTIAAETGWHPSSGYHPGMGDTKHPMHHKQP